MAHPRGYANSLIMYVDKNGNKVSALPFDTEDIYYLIRMSVQEARQFVRDDEDFDEDGVLRDDFSFDDAMLADVATDDDDSGSGGGGDDPDDDDSSPMSEEDEDSLFIPTADDGDEDEDEDEDDY